MGYSKTLDLGDSFSFGTTPKAMLTIPALVGDVTIGTFVTPLNVNVRKAYVDIRIGRISSDSANPTNHLNTTIMKAYCGVQHYGCLTLPDGSLNTIGAVANPGAYYSGTSDVPLAFSPGLTTTVYLNNCSADSDHLYLYDVQAIANLIV